MTITDRFLPLSTIPSFGRETDTFVVQHHSRKQATGKSLGKGPTASPIVFGEQSGGIIGKHRRRGGSNC